MTLKMEKLKNELISDGYIIIKETDKCTHLKKNNTTIKIG